MTQNLRPDLGHTLNARGDLGRLRALMRGGQSRPQFGARAGCGGSVRETGRSDHADLSGLGRWVDETLRKPFFAPDSPSGFIFGHVAALRGTVGWSVVGRGGRNTETNPSGKSSAHAFPSCLIDVSTEHTCLGAKLPAIFYLNSGVFGRRHVLQVPDDRPDDASGAAAQGTSSTADFGRHHKQQSALKKKMAE